MPTNKAILAIILDLTLAILVLNVINSGQPLVNIAKGTNVNLTLYGDFPGWNFTKPSGINPTIIVTRGDTVSITAIGQDNLLHRFWLDVNNNRLLDCPTTDKCSPDFNLGQTVFVPTFTADFAAATYTYYCFYHQPTMLGSFIVQDFSISASPASVGPLSPSTSGTSTITVTPQNGFAGTVTLTATSSAGLSATLSSTTISGASGTSTLTVSSATAGSYTVTVTGTSGSDSHSVVVPVTVAAPATPDFSISSSPTTLSIAQGSSGNSTITLTSLNGFSGSVTLSVAVSPTGPTASVSPTSVSLSSGGTGTAVLRVSTSSGAYSSTATGSYTITVTGTSGSLSHSMSLSITIQSSSGGNNALVPILTGAVAVAIVVAGTLFYLTRRGKSKR